MSQEVNKTNDAVQEEVKKSERDMANEAYLNLVWV